MAVGGRHATRPVVDDVPHLAEDDASVLPADRRATNRPQGSRQGRAEEFTAEPVGRACSAGPEAITKGYTCVMAARLRKVRVRSGRTDNDSDHRAITFTAVASGGTVLWARTNCLPCAMRAISGRRAWGRSGEGRYDRRQTRPGRGVSPLGRFRVEPLTRPPRARPKVDWRGIDAGGPTAP